MSSTTVDSLNAPTDKPAIWLAVGLSLLMHTLIVHFYPQLNLMKAIKLPQRIEVQMNTKVVPPVVEPPPPMPPPPMPKGEQLENPEPPRPKEKPVQRTKPIESRPVLSTQAPEGNPQHVVAPPSPTPAEQSSTQESVEKIAAYGIPDGKEISNVQVLDTPPENASDDEAWDGYGQQLYDTVSKNKHYPAIALRRNLEGEVTILAKFNKGELVSVSIIQSSGHQSLDDEALRMVKKAIAAQAVKGTLSKKSFNIKVPVSFKLVQS
ncbi:MAG: TonB family protein [Betaproteobacteria bacterium]|nr:TonB family protein [Betaproteobacteria bacterium]